MGFIGWGVVFFLGGDLVMFCGRVLEKEIYFFVFSNWFCFNLVFLGFF